MLANSMHAAVAQAMRASARTLSAAQSSSTSSAASRALLARGTFLITPSYKARVAVRGYATATATTTKKASATKTTKPRAAAAKGAKKPAAKKAPVKAKAKAKAKKPAAKPKKKKVVAKKAAPKKRAKKVLTEEQKSIALRRILKKTALLGEEPKKLPYTPWLVYIYENLQGMTPKGVADAAVRNQTFSENMARLAASWKDLSTSEKSRIDQTVKDNRAANAANLKKWVSTHTIEEINAANNARARLNREYPTVTVGPKIVDDRQPKRPCTAFAHFVKAQTAGTIGGTHFKDLGTAWRALPESDKKPYLDLMEAEKARYLKDVEASGLRTSHSA